MTEPMTDKSLVDLKPCPFCGSGMVAQGATGRRTISVWCMECAARGPEAPFPDFCEPVAQIRQCHDAWNTRSAATIISELQAELWHAKNDLANSNDNYHEVSTRLEARVAELQAAIERLTRELEDERLHRQRLQRALSFWMPSVSEDVEVETNGRTGSDAYLLMGYDGPLEQDCWGDKVLARALTAEAQRDGAYEAAQEVIDRWDTPNWKDVPATAIVINKLRAAIRAAKQKEGAKKTAESEHYPSTQNTRTE